MWTVINNPTPLNYNNNCRVLITLILIKVSGDYFTAISLGPSGLLWCRPLINNPPPFNCLDIGIPISIPIKGEDVY